MNYKELVRDVASELNESQLQVDRVLRCAVIQMKKELSKKIDVRIKGFGVLEPKKVKARTGMSIRDGQIKKFPSFWTVRFRLGRTLRDQINGPKPLAFQEETYASTET